MAGNFQVSIKDEGSARRWLQMVQDINEDYRVAMEGAAEVLQNVGDFAEGTIVDDLTNFGDSMLTAATQVFQGIDTIADTVGEILETVGNFLGEAKDFISSTMDRLFG